MLFRSQSPEQAFYNPSNPKEITLDIEFTDVALGTTIAFGVAYFVMVVAVWILMACGLSCGCSCALTKKKYTTD